MFKITIRLMLVLVFALCCLQPAQAAPVTQDLEIILDASGSMRGKIGSRTKMDIAKKALSELVRDLGSAGGLALAIRVYGHQSPRQKKDCRDSKLEIPFGPVDQAGVEALLKKIRPQGYTPLAFSLKQALGDFSRKDRSRTIILITDGLETCQGNPCQAAKKLAAAGLKVTLHVVGFDLQKKQMQKLSCLSKPSGGLLLEAKDASELNQALKKAVKQVVEKNLIVSAKNKAGKPREVHVEVFKAGGKQRLAIHQGPVTGFRLPPGDYDLVVRDFKSSQVVRLNQVKVKKEEITKKEVVIDTGSITVILKSTKGGVLKGYAEVIRTEPGQKQTVKGDYLTGKPKTFNLVAGNYTIRARVDKMGRKKIIENVLVKPGREVVRELVFGQARLWVAAKDSTGKALPAYIEVWRLEDGNPKGYKSGTAKDKPLGFTVTPGQYRIKVKRRDTGQKLPPLTVDLTDGADLTKEVIFPPKP